MGLEVSPLNLYKNLKEGSSKQQKNRPKLRFLCIKTNEEANPALIFYVLLLPGSQQGDGIPSFKSDELWVLGGLAHSDLKVREGLRKNTAQHRRTQGYPQNVT